jgi:ribonuclease J
MKNKELRILPLGGMGEVTQNMFLYMYGQEILIVDCGIGFPDQYMPGVDIIIPDIGPLQKELEKGKKIVGMILTHGHDDHIAALPYLLPDLLSFPIYASPLTAGFAQERLKDGGVKKKIRQIDDGNKVSLGNHFGFTAFPVTHSVPDTKHFVINNPEGRVYHGTDFKLDPNPVDGVLTDFEAISNAGKEGISIMLMDCLRVERSRWSKSESTVGPAIEQEINDAKGKFIVTLMSSHIHRIQQVVDVAVKHDRKVTFVGRSVEQNVKVATRLGKLNIPQNVRVDKRKMDQYPDDKLVVIIAGSQGQEGSSMVRAVYGEHRAVKIKPDDKVVFSADAIPGNEVPYYRAINELSRNQIDVVYPDLSPNVHHTGHASAAEQQELLSLVKPGFVMPIGGDDRHRELFRKNVAKKLGYSDHQVLLPDGGEIVSFKNNNWKIERRIKLHPRIVDGLGVGDVGPTVLSDRRALSEAGIVVVVIPRAKDRFDVNNIRVISRGFVFMKQADEVVSFIKENTADLIKHVDADKSDYKVKKNLQKTLSRKLFDVIQRKPIIVPVFLDQDQLS